MKTPGSIPPSGPHGICSTFWTWGISQTSPGHQSPVDILTWPKGCPLCPGGRRPRTPTCSLPNTRQPRRKAAIPQATGSSSPSASRDGRPLGGASRPTPSSPCRCPNSRGPESPEEAGGTSDTTTSQLQAKGTRFHLQVRGIPNDVDYNAELAIPAFRRPHSPSPGTR